MKKSSFLVFSALLLVGSLLAACSSPVEKTNVKPYLLTKGDLPHLGDPSPAPVVGRLSQICQQETFNSTPAISKGTVAFKNGSDLPIVTQYLGSYKSGKQAFNEIYNQLKICHPSLATNTPKGASVGMESIRIPSIGDQSEAFAQQIYALGNSATQNIVIARKGDFVTIVGEEDLGSDFKSFVSMAKTAVAKIPAQQDTSSAPAKTRTPSPQPLYPATGFGGYNYDGTFTQVSASWRVPTIDETSTPGAASMWIGVQSASGTNVFVQVGITMSRTDSGVDVYRAFWSDIAHSFEAQDLGAVSPNDLVSARIYQANGEWDVAFSDKTRSMTKSVKTNDDVQLEAMWAQWLVEDPAPSSHTAVDLPFPQMSAPAFTQLAVNGAPPVLTRADGQVLISPNNIALVPTDVDDASFTFYEPTGAALDFLNAVFTSQQALNQMELQLQSWAQLSLDQKQLKILALANSLQDSVTALETTQWPSAVQPAINDFTTQLKGVMNDVDNWNASDHYTTIPVSVAQAEALRSASIAVRASLGLPTGT
jgi:hypothetical protein